MALLIPFSIIEAVEKGVANVILLRGNVVSIKNGKKIEKLLFTKGERMNVSEMKIGEVGIVKKITATEPLKSRLFSLGIVKGEKIRILKYTIAKNTFEVEVNKSKIALREDEAKMITVEVKK